MRPENPGKERWEALFRQAIKHRAFFAAAYLLFNRRKVETTLGAKISEDNATSCEAMFKYTLH